jgi:VanZ family protein
MGVIFYMSGPTGGEEGSHYVLSVILNTLAPGAYAELSPKSQEALDFWLRKAGHVSEYAILTLLVLRYALAKNRKSPIVLAGAVAFLYACSDEFHQLFVPGRSGAVRDVFIDGIGIGGIMIVALLWRLHGVVLQRLTPTNVTDV